MKEVINLRRIEIENMISNVSVSLKGPFYSLSSPKYAIQIYE